MVTGRRRAAVADRLQVGKIEKNPHQLHLDQHPMRGQSAGNPLEGKGGEEEEERPAIILPGKGVDRDITMTGGRRLGRLPLRWGLTAHGL